MAPIRDLINDDDDDSISGEGSYSKNTSSVVTSSTAASSVAEIYTSFPQINHTEVTKLMIQTLTDLGYNTASEALKKESGLNIESPEINDFMGYLNSGEWKLAIKSIPKLKLIPVSHHQHNSRRRKSSIKSEMDSSMKDADEVEEDEETRTLIKFLIQRERFLEELFSECEEEEEEYQKEGKLEEGGSSSVELKVITPSPTPNHAPSLKLLEFIQTDLRSLVSPNTTKITFENIKHLTSLLFDQRSLDLQLINGWYGSVSSSRANLIAEITKHIDPNEMIPKFRLFKLLDQSLSHQKQTNLFNFPSLEQSRGQISLFEDIQWDRTNFPNSHVKTLSLHDDEIWFVLFNHTGSLLVSCSKDGSVLVYDVKEGFKLKYNLEGHDKGAMYASFSPSGSLLLTCGMQGQSFLWDVTTGKLRSKVDVLGNNVRIWCCDWVNEDELILGSPDKVVARYNHTKGIIVQKWEGSIVNDLKLTGDKNHLICGTYTRNMEVYDLKTGEKISTIPVNDKITSITASQSNPSTVLVNVTPDELQLWDWTQGVLLSKYIGHNQRKFIVRSCFGYDETLVLSGSEDGRVFIWNKDFGSLLGCFKAHVKGNTNSVAWCPDQELFGGCCFVTGGDDGKVQVWGPEMFSSHNRK